MAYQPRTMLLCSAVAAILVMGGCSEQKTTAQESADESANISTPVAEESIAADNTGEAPLILPVSTVERAGYPALPDIVLGEPDAPVTVIEYASLSCIHCAEFNRQVMPQLKNAYIKAGTVKMIYRDFPLDGLSLRGAQLARCLPDDQFHDFIQVLFEGRSQWLNAEGDTAPIEQMALMAGLSEEAIKECLANTALEEAILASAVEARDTLDLSATPTIVINGEKHTGDTSFEALARAIDAAAAKAAVE